MALSREQIVGEAVALLDEGGLEAVTFRRLAERLGVRSPSLFWHVRNKALLLEAMAEAILAPAFETIEPPAPGERWQDWLVGLAGRLRLALLAHPDGARLVSSAQLSETMATITERALATLVAQGMPLREARLVVLAVERFTVGHVLEEQAPRPDESVLAGFDLAAFSRRHPLVTTAIAEYFEPGRTVDDLFSDTLRVIIH